VKKHDEQRQRTINGIAHRDDEHRCNGNYERKIEKERLFHHASSTMPQSLPAQQTIAREAQDGWSFWSIGSVSFVWLS
jgi:hypothetical protein